MKNTLLSLVLLLLGSFGMVACSQLFWDTDLGSKKSAPKSSEKKAEVAPEGLDRNSTNPISPPDESRTAVSRSKIVSVQEFGTDDRGQKKYFEVVDETIEKMANVKADPSARPVRMITYDNNAIQKDYPMKFGVAWGRTLEAMLDMPLSTTDKSSGIITTAWVYDRVKDNSGLVSLSLIMGAPATIRYKYTVRLLSRGGMTQIKVVPHAEMRKPQQWITVRPKLLVTKKLFDRIELELRTPLLSDRF